jgi:hypothetical protein
MNQGRTCGGRQQANPQATVWRERELIGHVGGGGRAGGAHLRHAGLVPADGCASCQALCMEGGGGGWGG